MKTGTLHPDNSLKAPLKLTPITYVSTDTLFSAMSSPGKTALKNQCTFMCRPTCIFLLVGETIWALLCVGFYVCISASVIPNVVSTDNSLSNEFQQTTRQM